jgi:hypothetical protein
MFRVLLLSLFLFSCSEPKAKPIKSEIPNWFGKLEKKDFEIVGYGFGENLEEAKERARIDISRQISVKIESRTERALKSENGNFSKSFSENSTQKSEIVLSDLEIVKVSENGKYVALKFANLPFEKKFLSKLGDWKCSESLFFEKTSLGKFAKSEKGCIPKLDIFKNGNSFFLNSDEVSQFIPNLETLFFNFDNRNIELEIPTEIQENKDFDIGVKTVKSGFLTVLVVSENGEVFEIISNLKIQKNRKVSLSKIQGQNFYGKIENGKDFEKNMFVAIFSNENLENRFLKIRSENEKIFGFGFQKLPKILNSKNIEFETKIQTLFSKVSI